MIAKTFLIDLNWTFTHLDMLQETVCGLLKKSLPLSFLMRPWILMTSCKTAVKQPNANEIQLNPLPFPYAKISLPIYESSICQADP
jgi:hypothetical protein